MAVSRVDQNGVGHHGTSAGATIWSWSALVVALAGAVGTIYLSLGMNLIPCPLCYYQRTFMMGAFGVLALGLLVARQQAMLVSLLTLPLALGGLGVASIHVLRESEGVMECPPGVFGIGTAPQQSLAVVLLLTLLLLGDVIQRAKARLLGIEAVAVGLLVGVLLVIGSVVTADSRQIRQDGPLIGCRPTAK